MAIICRLEKLIYQNPSNGYTVAVYASKEVSKIPAAAVKEFAGDLAVFTAVGTELPCCENMEYEMEGAWKESERYGRQLVVEWFRIILPKSRDGIIAYLSSDLVKGIGPATARKIVDEFGTETFRILDHQPEKLLEIKGISENRLKEILLSYQNSTGLRELMTFLAPFGVTPKKAERIQEHFGLEAVRIVKENPYQLCEIKGFGFFTVDPIARASMKFQPDDLRRIKACIIFVLHEAEGEGDLYLENRSIVDRAYTLLNQGFSPAAVSENKIIQAGNEMVLKDRTLQADIPLKLDGTPDREHTAVYLAENREDERQVVYDIFRLLESLVPVYDVEQELEEAQAEFGIILAEKQKEAVRMVFRSPFSIITGGPGKGKTTNLRVILRVFELVEKQKGELLCAPTGRARKRLSESTGYPALTIHKALYLTEEELELEDKQEFLEEDFIVVDEFTMADMHLARILFSRIKSGARVILVGDVDQLPSVGPGNVFKELIDSGVIPVTVLDVFFRQAKDSRIILNADRVNRNQKNLLFGDDFQFIYADTPKEAAEEISRIYLEELTANDNNLDMVQVLTPLRKNTEAGVIALNKRLQSIANPSRIEKAEWKTSEGLFRVGDKVMQTKNTNEISNGDIGRVTRIQKRKNGELEMTVNFGEVQKTYAKEDLNILEHAYATSIHKSQGGEFPVVILPVLTCFYPMLKRNVYYTGVTRARNRVYLVGSKKALYMAISNTDAGRRKTLLGLRLKQEKKRRMAAHPQKKAA